jgi:hypothetical protein
MFRSDVTLVAEAKEFQAHKLVLSCRGQWTNFSLSDVDRIELEDTSAIAARAVLRWVYTDGVDDSTTDVMFLLELLRAAHRFQLVELLTRYELDLSLVNLVPG